MRERKMIKMMENNFLQNILAHHGNHDQRAHGNWAIGTGSTKQEISGKSSQNKSATARLADRIKSDKNILSDIDSESMNKIIKRLELEKKFNDLTKDETYAKGGAFKDIKSRIWAGTMVTLQRVAQEQSYKIIDGYLKKRTGAGAGTGTP